MNYFSGVCKFFGNFPIFAFQMRAIVKYGILLIAVFCMMSRSDASGQEKERGVKEYVMAAEDDNFRQLAELTAMNANAVLVSTIHETVNVLSVARYLPRHIFHHQLEEKNRFFAPYFKYVENYYLASFALKQDRGYYVFALREILV